jgi:hypothetical protein
MDERKEDTMPNPLLLVTPNLTPVSPITELKRRADGIPRQESFFDVNDQPTENWAWVVLYRIRQYGPTIPDGIWMDWTNIMQRPNHFRSRLGAERRIAQVVLENKQNVKAGLIQYKIEPKYIGYVPSKDEAWIAD